ncbi:hypothetical protein, partial [Natrialba sp. PRR66]|uniref:hypothetical protein n=1 Tax=Natrialba sp. PRR66 TaxID=3098146 RepID=UPI002B1CF740
VNMAFLKVCLLFLLVAIAAVSSYQVVVHREIEPLITDPIPPPRMGRRPIIIQPPPPTTTDSQILGLDLLGLKAGLDTNLFDFL